MEFYFWGVCDNLLEALFGNWCSRAFRGPKHFFFFWIGNINFIKKETTSYKKGMK